jgi:hypothetical protein
MLFPLRTPECALIINIEVFVSMELGLKEMCQITNRIRIMGYLEALKHFKKVRNVV